MSRIDGWERRAEIPLLLLAGAFLVAYAWPILDPSIDRDLSTSLSVLSWTVWAAFAIDFIIRIALAEGERKEYILRHWYDAALIALPMLRPLRLLRALALARILNRTIARGLAGRVATYVVGTALASCALGSLAVLDAERGVPDANITTFGDALWWSTTTVTTVGYGDRYPVTTPGRLVAVALMLVGIALVGSVTATVAAWFIKHVDASEPTA